MESLERLKMITSKYLESNQDHDNKVEMVAFEIKHWCNDFLRIHQNIEETSISHNHRVERKEKLINEILSI
ncbi:hypothetical protein [Flavobacterium tructae]|uniref:Uncharacterized protein n=1 Tax=Flavobacterium tructae TaxID=1114873 RepID=A0A1S1J835_9FLAO|nr:hypothetical protein [Flavobacterium tructae]OHT44463.1 hypothetical protein BHE19_12150 [Flavobacterium tructae]OXB19401.1 hypothetical protein B0A71_12720 [Flavobacterium tructae]